MAKANLMIANLKTFSGLMSVVFKWRTKGDFAAVNRQTPKPKPRHMYRSSFLKARTVCIARCKD